MPRWPKKTAEERFWEKVVKSDGCWIFTGHLNNHGYGTFGITHDDRIYAHRYSYQLAYGPIPEGLVIDHICRTPPCVNPSHMEAVTQRENVYRGKSYLFHPKTHCKHGHELTEGNVYRRPDTGGRQCLTCVTRRNRNRYAKGTA